MKWSILRSSSLFEVKIFLIGAKDEKKEKERIEKRKQELKKLILNIKKKFKNKKFVERAPKAVVDQEKEKLAGFESELKELD